MKISGICSREMARRTRVLRLLSVCMFRVIFPVRSFAQRTRSPAQNTGGSIIGTVTEKHGGPLAGAPLRVSNAQTGLTASVSTDVNGQFTVENLLGEYKVSVSANGLVNARGQSDGQGRT